MHKIASFCVGRCLYDTSQNWKSKSGRADKRTTTEVGSSFVRMASDCLHQKQGDPLNDIGIVNFGPIYQSLP